MNYQRYIKGKTFHIIDKYDYYIFTYIPESCEWKFTKYINVRGGIENPEDLKKDQTLYGREIIRQSCELAKSLYINSNLWVL